MAISTASARELVGRSAVCTTIAGGAAGLSALMWSHWTRGIYDLVAVCNGILAGLVAITAGCACVEPWAAMIIGSTGALVFSVCDNIILARFKVRLQPAVLSAVVLCGAWQLSMGSDNAQCALQIDDPLSASALHGCIGMWGALMVAWFAKPAYLLQQLGLEEPDAAHLGDHRGLFYGGNGKLLACQCIGAIPWCLPRVSSAMVAARSAPLCATRQARTQLIARMLTFRASRRSGVDWGAHDSLLLRHQSRGPAARLGKLRDDWPG